jgi:putative ABC transport system permease protein
MRRTTWRRSARCAGARPRAPHWPSVGVGALAASATADGTGAAQLVGLGGLALVLAAIALSPVLARPFARSVGAVLPRLWSTVGHLARENAQRNPRRTAATASALMVGLALVSAFSILGSSANASVEELVDTAVRADYVVSTASASPSPPRWPSGCAPWTACRPSARSGSGRR